MATTTVPSQLTQAPSTATPPTQLHSIPASAKRIGVSRSYLYELMSAERIKSVRIGRRRLISEAALVEYIEGLSA